MRVILTEIKVKLLNDSKKRLTFIASRGLSTLKN